MKPPALRLVGARIPFGGALGSAPELGAPGLDDVDLEVQAGERLVLVGASGEGKTTLLRAVAGLAPLAAGRIEIGGREVTTLAPEKRGAVYLHQTPVLFPHLSVEANVAFPLRMRGVPRNQIAHEVAALLEAVQLQELGRRSPSALSGGQRHRVALARAVAARPALLLLDEPLSSLDPQLRHEVRGAIVALQERYRPGLVLVTHDLEEAGILGHRVGLLLGGRLAQVDTPGALFRRPSTLEISRFLGYRNEVPLETDSALAALLGAARSGTAASLPRGVAVLPPGCLRVVAGPDTPPGAPRSPTARVEAKVEATLIATVHPGPRPLARIRVEGGTSGGLELEADLTPGDWGGGEPAPGDRVQLRILLDQVLFFP